jgi:hypothetical protein
VMSLCFFVSVVVRASANLGAYICVRRKECSEILWDQYLFTGCLFRISIVASHKPFMD